MRSCQEFLERCRSRDRASGRQRALCDGLPETSGLHELEVVLVLDERE